MAELSDDDLRHLSALPRALAARILLSDQSIAGGAPQRGPLAALGVSWTLDQAQVAYLLWCVWTAGKRQGEMLFGKPNHEALELLGNRALGASQRSTGFRAFYYEITGKHGLILGATAIRSDDLADWLGFAATDKDGRRWRRFCAENGVKEALDALRFLVEHGYLWQTHPSAATLAQREASAESLSAILDVHPDDPPAAEQPPEVAPEPAPEPKRKKAAAPPPATTSPLIPLFGS